MKKSFMNSNTTQSVAAGGAVGASAMSILMLLQTLFPDLEDTIRTALLTGSTWFINMILIPWASRMIARARGK